MVKENKLKLMLVDEEESIRKVVEMTLNDKYQVYPLADFKKALEEITAVSPDILLLDVKNDGYHANQFLEDLLKREVQIPAIIMTGNPDERRAAESVYYAQRMYTEEQQKALGIELDNNVKAVQEKLGRLNEVTSTEKNIEPYFLSKPFSRNTLIGYLERIAAIIEKKP